MSQRGIGEIELEPERVMTIQIVAEESLVSNEALLLVQTNGRRVRHFGFKDYLEIIFVENLTQKCTKLINGV